MCRILGEKCMFNLVRATMERALISSLRWKRKDSLLRRFLNCHKYFKIGTFSSQLRCGCHNSLFAGDCSRKSYASCWMIDHKQKGSDQFMCISNNNSEYSRYEYFDLTRMFNKQCFCDSNIPSSYGWLHLNHFPLSIISNRIQKLNASMFCSLSKKSRDSRHARNNRFGLS